MTSSSSKETGTRSKRTRAPTTPTTSTSANSAIEDKKEDESDAEKEDEDGKTYTLSPHRCMYCGIDMDSSMDIEDVCSDCKGYGTMNPTFRAASHRVENSNDYPPIGEAQLETIRKDLLQVLPIQPLTSIVTDYVGQTDFVLHVREPRNCFVYHYHLYKAFLEKSLASKKARSILLASDRFHAMNASDFTARENRKAYGAQWGTTECVESVLENLDIFRDAEEIARAMRKEDAHPFSEKNERVVRHLFCFASALELRHVQDLCFLYHTKEKEAKESIEGIENMLQSLGSVVDTDYTDKYTDDKLSEHIQTIVRKLVDKCCDKKTIMTKCAESLEELKSFLPIGTLNRQVYRAVVAECIMRLRNK